MNQEQLNKILSKHNLWIDGGAEGIRADLSGADLRWADLSGADLTGANIDYACWPLWCGGLHVKTDRRIMAQLAYHFCAQDCDDPDYIKARNAIIDFANTFHRVEECGPRLALKMPGSGWRGEVDT